MIRKRVLENWQNLKKAFQKNKIGAREEIKFALHELVLTLSSEQSSNHSDYFKSALEKYKGEMPKEVKEVLESSRTLPIYLKRWYYQPITLWIKDRARELGASWEDNHDDLPKKEVD